MYNISPRVDTGIHVEKRIKTDGTVQTVASLYAGGMPFGTVTTVQPPNNGTQTTYTRYFHTDHLGSIVALTNESGTVTERRSYDAWGKRRNSNGTPMTSAFVTPDERHGFTGHEEWDEVGLIHMNGRLYDPTTGRFLSADPTIQYADDMQNYNRYSYINNNPLSAVDYSGYGFLSKVWREAKRAVRNVGRAVSSVLRNPTIRTIASIAAAYYTGVDFMGTGSGIFGANAAIANGAAGGFAGGLVAGRGDLRVAIQGAITGAAMGYVGDTWKVAGSFGNVAGHAVVGCGSAVMGGGSCASGALAGGFSGWAAPKIPSSWEAFGGAVASAVIGGTASVLGGGKFENGAMTGAFGYLFNYLAHDQNGNLVNIEDSPAIPREGIEPFTLVEDGLLGGGALKMGAKLAFSGGANSVFWSGFNQGALDVARTLGTNLESTAGGRVLNYIHHTLGVRVPDRVWDWASATFARQARGTAKAVIRANGKVWTNIEKPILEKRGIPIEYH